MEFARCAPTWKPSARGQLQAEREDMDDIIHAIERIHEHRLDFKPAAVNKGG